MSIFNQIAYLKIKIPLYATKCSLFQIINHLPTCRQRKPVYFCYSQKLSNLIIVTIQQKNNQIVVICGLYSFYSYFIQQIQLSQHSIMIKTQSKASNSGLGAQTGKRIQNYIYNYNDIIGKGNFAKVYRGLNTKTSKLILNSDEAVAIKIISLDELKSKRLEELVFEQIRILQLMNHPNILKFHEALLSDRNCYIVTEICNEGDLNDRIKKSKTFADAELSKVILDVYEGLKYLKQMGVTHRDLKPANIFMHDGQAKIADFGLAKFYKQNFKDLDIGSPPYMSPQGLIQNIYGEKTDVWSFGIVIYEMLHGESPFSCYKTYQQLFAAVTVPLPQYKFKKNISPVLKQLINSLLQIYMKKRPSIAQVAKDPFISCLLAAKDQSIQANLKKFSFNNASHDQLFFNTLNHVKTCPKIPTQKQMQLSTNEWHQKSANMQITQPMHSFNNKSQQFNETDRAVTVRYFKQQHIRSPMHNLFNEIQSKQPQQAKRSVANHRFNLTEPTALMKKSAFQFSLNNQAVRYKNNKIATFANVGNRYRPNPSYNSLTTKFGMDDSSVPFSVAYF